MATVGNWYEDCKDKSLTTESYILTSLGGIRTRLGWTAKEMRFQSVGAKGFFFLCNIHIGSGSHPNLLFNQYSGGSFPGL
jgi:hypothetical protein